jgi:hypothetical protein
MSAWKPFSFRPRFAGEVTFDEVPADVFRRIERRVSEGLLFPGVRVRANYRVTQSGQGTLEFEAVDNLTAWNVGLNRVILRRAGARAIGYEVTFWRWTRYCLALAGGVGGSLALVYVVMPAVRREVASYSHGVWIYFGMIAFWALVWPWCLTAIHRPFARKLLERILRETIENRPAARRAA